MPFLEPVYLYTAREALVRFPATAFKDLFGSPPSVLNLAAPCCPSDDAACPFDGGRAMPGHRSRSFFAIYGYRQLPFILPGHSAARRGTVMCWRRGRFLCLASILPFLGCAIPFCERSPLPEYPVLCFSRIRTVGGFFLSSEFPERSRMSCDARPHVISVSGET